MRPAEGSWSARLVSGVTAHFELPGAHSFHAYQVHFSNLKRLSDVPIRFPICSRLIYLNIGE